ncbi:hypothetical protein BJ170DRAFT_596388 [Xylariales sp. AK1849]|nr:hypothetical protein BJ170DRAFT_596388 [Xylariales sp. AK1849]
MQPIYLLVACLAALVTAQACTGDQSIVGYCTPETWTALPINSSAPTNAECQDACQGVNSDAGDWFANLTGIADNERRTVVGYPCQFALGRGPGQVDPLEFSFANQDILDIYDGVISRFGSSGRTAATGTMVCEGKQVTWWVD